MRGARDVVLPPVAIDRRLAVLLHRQIRAEIAGAIRAGLPGGSCLPSTRPARLPGVSRKTVPAAHDELAADGLIQGRRGAGMLVARQGRVLAHVPASRRILRDARFPVRTPFVTDRDGTAIALTC